MTKNDISRKFWVRKKIQRAGIEGNTNGERTRSVVLRTVILLSTCGLEAASSVKPMETEHKTPSRCRGERRLSQGWKSNEVAVLERVSG